ncbi:MAG TPA: response regulator [Burkholderiaceae bacterium]|nr:response regulator [Burkholderiaceae bacterium]
MLPLAAESGRAEAARVHAAEVPRAKASMSGRVMIVEDDLMVGDYMVEQLAAWGLQPVLEREPLTALGLLQDASFDVDLVITDHTMPKMTGLQLARRVRRERPALPIWSVSGNLDADALRSAGVTHTLSKPIQVDSLRALLRATLGGG